MGKAVAAALLLAVVLGTSFQLSTAQTERCPTRCLCFRTTVRCMFLGLRRVPRIPSATTILDLRFNEIEILPPGTFRHLTNLNTLLLNNNRISHLRSGAFHGLGELRYLYMYKNKIRHIDEDAFSGLPKLEQLYLHYNYIASLPPGVFSQLPAMERLFLHNNQLQRIPYGAFSNLTSLKRLRLDSNALVCDCQMLWLAHTLQERASTAFTSAICEQPAELHGRNVADLRDNMLYCSAPQLTEEPEDIQVSFGKTAYFHCKADGNPQPDIVWLHNSNEIDPSSELRGGYHVLNDGTLMVEPSAAAAAPDAQLVFECVAKNPMGEVRSGPVSVRFVPEASSSSSSPASPRLEEREQHQQPAVPRRGRPVTADPRRFRSDNREDNRLSPAGTLNQRSRLSHGGQDNRIDAGAAPRFVLAPQDIRVGVGELAHLRCSADGSPTPELLWLRGNNPITTQTPRYRIRFAAHETNLTIINVQPQDTGEYRCQATNRHGSINAAAQVILQTHPRITSPPQDRTVLPGSNIDLTCGARGYPLPEVSWLRNGQRIVHSSRVAVLAGGGVLRITNVQHVDAGTYTCIASNTAGSDRREADLDVTGRAGPVLLERPPQVLSASVGEDLVLTCHASGAPTPQVSWRKAGGNLFADGRHSSTLGGVLTLRSLTTDDTGIYECNVDNGIGHAVATTRLTVNEIQPRIGGAPGDEFLSRSVAEATREVEIAVNQTLRQLFSQPRHQRRTPQELLQILRFPTGEALDVARAGEIFERALDMVKRLVESGSMFNLTQGFSYTELLSPVQLDRLSELSGCSAHRRRPNCTNICYHSRYRTADGTCNNLQHPLWGASLTGFRRLLPPQYENGFNTPRGVSPDTLYNGFVLPNARLVSTSLARSTAVTEDSRYSAMLMQWGQFVDHDLDHALPAISVVSFDGQHECDSTCENRSPCFNVGIPPGEDRESHHRCMRVVRSSTACGSGTTSVFGHGVMPREQVNALTSFIDASMIYGSTETQAHHLRDLASASGRLRSGIFTRPHKPLMPFNDGEPVDCQRDTEDRSDIGCFMAGDVRANEQLGLSAMHTVWMREHNRVADELARLNPHWHGEEVYQETRRIVTAQIQHITYQHWLPLVLGPAGLELMGGEYSGYKPNVDASVSNAFATAAFRFGHGLVQPILYRLNETLQPIPEGNLPLHKAFFAPWRIVQEGGIDPILRGLFAAPAKEHTPEQLLNTELTEKLFKLHHRVALDLAAVNIQRGRDHGLPGYNAWREQCGLRPARSYDDFAREIQSAQVRRKLRELYGHPDNVDLWLGGMLESHVTGAKMGPTFLCVIADQFGRARDGDRFWYEAPGQFTPAQLTQLRQANLARVLCDNGDALSRVSRDVFVLPGLQQGGGMTGCEEVPGPDLRFWADCRTCRGDDCSEGEAARPGRIRRSALVDPHRTVPEAADPAEPLDLYHLEDANEERIQGLEEAMAGLHRRLARMRRQLRRLQHVQRQGTTPRRHQHRRHRRRH